MFSRLIASGKRRMSWIRSPGVVIASVAVHLLVLAGVVWAAGREGPPAAERPPEEITFIDITQLPPPPEEIFETPPPEAEAPAPAPAQASPAAPAPRAPAVPRTQPAAPTTSERPAGFQELRVPDPPAGIPAPDISAPAVSAEDFGGRGAIGGVAGGTPAPAPPVSGTGRGVPGGTGTGTAGGDGSGPPTGTFTANLVDSPARLTNPGDVARTLQRLYPDNLRATGVTGRVVVEMVVSAQGRVEPGSARVVSAAHPGFTDVSLRAVEQFRFTPARVGPHAVRMRVQIPINWTLN